MVVCTYGFVCWLCIMMMIMIDYVMVWYVFMLYVNMVEDSGLVSLYDMYSLNGRFCISPTFSFSYSQTRLTLQTKTTPQQGYKMPVSPPPPPLPLNHKIPN